MNKFLAAFLKLLPAIITGVQKQAVNAAGKDKKQMVIDGLNSVAEGVAALAPEHATAANDAAQVAAASLEGVLQILKDTGHPVFAPPVPSTK